MNIQAHIEKEFILDPDIICLNHAAVSPWPLRTCEAVEAFARENAQQGSRNYPLWLKTEQALRQQGADLINAPSADDIALLKNTSEALSVVAYGIDWQPGDNVIISDQEFPSNRIVWEPLTERGVEVRQIDLASHDTPEAALIAAADATTRLLSISSVQYASGLRVKLEPLGEHCRQHDILFCVDAIQSIGALPVDVQAIHADFVMADGHKWMMGPEGLALFYARQGVRDQLRLHQYGWHMVEQVGDFDRKEWQAAQAARRFECGSPNMLTIHALQASLSLIEDVGMQAIAERVLANSEMLFDLISNSHNLTCLTDSSEDRYAGIVVFEHQQAVQHTLYEHLMQHGIMCAERGGGIRFSPHFYTDRDKLATAIGIADQFSS